MAILFTADWHLKLGQKNVPVSWALDRYDSFFKQIEEIKCDLHIVGGDLFDRVPSMQELELYFKFVANTKHKTIIYDGNHEATKKNHTFFSQLKSVTASINPNVIIVDTPLVSGTYGLSILPYNTLHKKDWDLPTDMPLYTHVRGEIPPHVKPEIDLSIFDKFPIVFAGDLHSHSNSQRNIVYPGSPMTTSFHRSEVETGYLLIEGTEWDWKAFALPQLIRKTVTSEKDMVPTEYHHTIYELEGDIQELSGVKNSELLDKKVVKRNTETALIMDKDMTIAEELAEYLRYILEISDNQIDGILKTYHDYAKNAELE